MTFSYPYPRPALTTDCIVFSDRNELSFVLLIQRDKPPFEGQWALPGGFLDMDETLDECAARELFEETGLNDIPLEQFRSYGTIGRDPRGRTISVVYIGFVNRASVEIKAGDDARNVKWFPVNDLPDLAFDHNEIVKQAIDFISVVKIS